MIITVWTADEEHEFDATKFTTDEHNNLEIHGAEPCVFNRSCWQRVEVTDGED